MVIAQLAKDLGRLQASIYWLHDAEQFDELAIAASQIYQLLGHSQLLGDQVGDFIAEAYRISDAAQIARFAGDSQQELEQYAAAQWQLAQAAQLLGLPEEIAEYQVQWWRLSRHKQLIAALNYLLKQHGQFSQLERAKLAYFLVQIGLGHDQKKSDRCEQYSIYYWRLFLKSKVNDYPYIG